jgi:hypothetical protein
LFNFQGPLQVPLLTALLAGLTVYHTAPALSTTLAASIRRFLPLKRRSIILSNYIPYVNCFLSIFMLMTVFNNLIFLVVEVILAEIHSPAGR